MYGKLSRRDFLKLGATSLGCLAIRPLRPIVPEEDPDYPIGRGRVAVEVINLYQNPSFNSPRIGRLQRDDLFNIYEELTSPTGPSNNPIWYYLKHGYTHSARIQRVDPRPPNPPLQSIPAGGILGEITIPYTRSYQYSRLDGWQPLYRLYYETVHWITGLDEGPTGQPWYRITDYLMNAAYSLPAVSVRPIQPGEYAPLSRGVPPGEKRLGVSITNQTLTAYEGDKIVLHTLVSSGLPSENLKVNEPPTDTPLGSFRIQLKMPSRHMGDGHLTSDLAAYELPGVSWTSIFHETGVAFHGTYWHNNFGRRMSHGCVNMRTREALWLFRWTDPVFEPLDYYTKGVGTLVIVRE